MFTLALKEIQNSSERATEWYTATCFYFLYTSELLTFERNTIANFVYNRKIPAVDNTANVATTKKFQDAELK